MKTKNRELKKIIKNIPDEKILQLAIRKPFFRSSAPKSEIIREAKRLPRIYFTKEELLKYKPKSVKKSRVESLKDIIKNVSDEKILKLMKGRSFDTDKRQILYQAKTWPEKYFTKEELIKYSKEKKGK